MKLFFKKINSRLPLLFLFLFIGSASFAQIKDSIVEIQPKKIADPKDHIVIDFSLIPIEISLMVFLKNHIH